MQVNSLIKCVFAALCWLMTCGLGSEMARAADKGPVTNLPLPRFVSMKAAEGNARRGPSLTHRVDWVFKHEDMPLMITGEYGHWRRVQDVEGQGGWMHYSLLSGVRTVTFLTEKTNMRLQPNDASATKAFAERGAIARLDECSLEWCRVFSGRVKGWIRKETVWGVGSDEIRE